MTKTYNPDEGFTVELEGVDDMPLFNEDGSRMTITVLGAESDVAVEFDNDLLTRRLAKIGAQTTGKAIQAEGSLKLAKITVAWNITPSKMVPGYDPGLGDGVPALTEGAATKFFSDRKLKVFKDKVEKASGERTNFLRG